MFRCLDRNPDSRLKVGTSGRRLIIILSILALATSSLAAGTWTAQTSGTTQNLNSVHFINSTTGIAVGEDGTVRRTTDGGSTWNTITINALDPQNYDFKAVHFPSATVGYAVGTYNGILGNTATVYKTLDGGLTWNPVSGTPNPNRPLNDVFSTSTDLGYICGNSAADVNVSKTDNGGTSWTNIPPEDTPDINFNGLYFVSADAGWVVADQRIFKTTNGGTGWTNQSPWVLNGAPPFMYDVFALNSNTAWAVGGTYGTEAEILKTIDGGTNWVRKSSGTSNQLNAVHFINEYFGYIVGNSGLLLTYNNVFDTWIATVPGSPTTNLTDIYFADAFHGWITGANGTIYAFNAAPTVSPSSRPQGWTGNLTITGDNFHPSLTATGCAFSGAGITINTLTRDSTTQLTVNVTIDPGATVSSRDLTITDPNGGTITATGAFTVNPPPTVISWSRPDKRTATWVTQGFSDFIEVNGTNFQNGAKVVFSGTGIATDSAFSDYSGVPTLIKVKVYVGKDATTSFRDITVTNPDTGSGTLASTFDIRPDTVGPAWSGLKLIYSPDEHDYTPNMSLPLTAAFKINVEDNTQITASSLNFKVQLWGGVVAEQLVPDLEHSYSEGHFTYTPDATNPNTKAIAQCTLPTSLTRDLATAGYFYLRFYGTDVEGNSRVSDLFQFQVQGGTLPPGVPQTITGLPSPNYEPSETNPMTFQITLSSDTAKDVTIRVWQLGGLPVAAIKTTLSPGVNNVSYDGVNQLVSDLLPNGLYSVMVNADDTGELLGKFRFIIFRR